MGFLQNACKPEGSEGERMLEKMNSGHHAELSGWGLSRLSPSGCEDILEIGCGGGANVAALLRICPDAKVRGVDYSGLSVKKSREVNAEAIRAGRCGIQTGNVSALSFPDAAFDLATAFETVYFWPDILACFREVFRVLKDGGTFFICNESDGENPADEGIEEEIEGMRIYEEDEIVTCLKRAGFPEVSVERKRERHWICFIARRLR